MLLSLGLILLCQLVGEAITRGAGVAGARPGHRHGAVRAAAAGARSVSGRLTPAELRDGTFEKTGRGILSHLSLLFIPAGVGVVQRLDVLAGNALAIAVAWWCRPPGLRHRLDLQRRGEPRPMVSAAAPDDGRGPRPM